MRTTPRSYRIPEVLQPISESPTQKGRYKKRGYEPPKGPEPAWWAEEARKTMNPDQKARVELLTISL